MSKSILKASAVRLTVAIVVALIGVIALLPASRASAGTVRGLYEIRNSATHKCLTVNGGNDDRLQPMIQFRCGSDLRYQWAYQKFQFESTESDGWFVIHPKSKPYRCLGMKPVPNPYVDGVILQQQTCNGTTAQMFALQFESLLPDGNHKVKIINNLSSKCMQVNGGERNWDDYALISQWSCGVTGQNQHLNWDFKWLASS